MKIKQIFINLSILLLSVTISLFVIEITTRQLGRAHYIQNKAFILTDYSVFSYKPNNQYTIKTTEYENIIKINSKGMRDNEYSYNKNNNTERIIMLGDSFVAGQEIPLENTISKKLEEKLNKEGKIKYEVINMGYYGFGPTPEVILLEKEGIKYNPDIVVLALFVGNDFIKVDFGISGNMPKEVFENNDNLENINFKATKIQKLKNFIFRNYFTYSYLKKTIGDIKNEQLAGEIYLQSIYKKQYPAPVEENLAKLKIILKHLKRYSDIKGLKLLVVLIPTKEQVDKTKFSEMVVKYNLYDLKPEIDKAQKIFLEFGRENNITMLNLLPEFKKRNLNNTFYFDVDGHWNEKGHELAAEMIYKNLQHNTLLT